LRAKQNTQKKETHLKKIFLLLRKWVRKKFKIILNPKKIFSRTFLCFLVKISFLLSKLIYLNFNLVNNFVVFKLGHHLPHKNNPKISHFFLQLLIFQSQSSFKQRKKIIKNGQKLKRSQKRCLSSGRNFLALFSAFLISWEFQVRYKKGFQFIPSKKLNKVLKYKSVRCKIYVKINIQKKTKKSYKILLSCPGNELKNR
jgi:hypothetical protein